MRSDNNEVVLKKASLDDKYALESGRAYMTGVEALVRLLILQRQRDALRGLNTAGFVSGYRGSPLGGLDQALWKAHPYLDRHQIRFQPGINEDLAMTAVRGTQEVTLFPGALHEGVFGMWYGKGPGLDRSMDALKHANAVGSSKYGGVLAVAGDDHGCISSSLPHQSEHDFIAASVPVLAPSNVQEILDYGILGWELSRYSGCWVGLKVCTEVCDSAAAVEMDATRIEVRVPQGFELPEDGLHARWPDSPMDQERRLNRHKIYAAREFARVNGLNRVVMDSPNPSLGIIATGKAYLDVLQAFDDLGIAATRAEALGIRLLKVGMPWPLEPTAIRDFARGLDEILVVEEKRSVIEDQLTGQLYNLPVEQRPRVVGEFDERGKVLLGNLGELNPADVARAIASRIADHAQSKTMKDRMAFLEFKEKALADSAAVVSRTPYYCSGCPHNTSTVVPEGSRAMAGIGCHYMAMWMDRDTETFTQMGAEGTTWIGQAHYTLNKHVFQNLGDGTYFHSGLLAIRAAVAAGVNITYKILYNDAVGMTGGQPVDGVLTVEDIVRQVGAEGVKRVAVVSDDPKKYPGSFPTRQGVSIHHRDQLDAVQRELRELVGTTVLIYDQTCAAEKRRRRKKGQLPDPRKRVFINQAVCEGCGDCNDKSNCLSVLPKETEFGRKRVIDQASCNKDFSCLKGFCPSFLTVEGADLRRNRVEIPSNMVLPTPVLPALDRPWNIVIAGIGGTGVATVGGILGMAAHLEDKGCSVFNLTGMAQKFGPVMSHVRIGTQPEDIQAPRVAAGDADLLMGCDLVVAASDESLVRVGIGRSHAVINGNESATADFIKDRDMVFPADPMKTRIAREAGQDRTHFVDATRIASELLGDSIAANMFLLGYVWQKGLIPVSAQAITNAIELNKVAVSFNCEAFDWGRRVAHQPQVVDELVPSEVVFSPDQAPLEVLVERRCKNLVDYQNADYATHYRHFVERVIAAEHATMGAKFADMAFSRAVVNNLFKLMAYKDEYEVARLYSSQEFIAKLEKQFENKPRLTFHLAPPLFARRNPQTGQLEKREFGPWLMQVFKILAKLKRLRGTRLDIFGYTAERRMERRLVEEYRGLIETLTANLTRANYSTAVALAELPQTMRGFGHVKEGNVREAEIRKQALLKRFTQREESECVVRIVEAAY